MKTLIAIPCFDHVPTQFCQSLALLQKVDECTLAMQAGSLVYTSRQDLARKSIEIDADYVFWLDSDMVFPPDTLARMMQTLKENDIDILTGLYFRRVPPFTPVLFDRLEMDGGRLLWSEFKELPSGLFEVGGCGFGCVLMKTDVFFDLMAKYENPFAPMGNNGEDIAFCIRARENGYKIICDPSVVCGHVGNYVVDNTMWEALR